jgi:hypothetical protein
MAIAVVVAADYWCQARGLPQAAMERLQAELDARGLPITVGSVYAGLNGDITLHDVTVTDTDLAGWTLLTADTVRLDVSLMELIKDEMQLNTIVIKGLNANTPITAENWEAAPVLTLENAEAIIRLTGDQVLVERFAGKLNGLPLALAGFVARDSRGGGKKTPTISSGTTTTRPRSFSVARYLPTLDSKDIARIHRILDFWNDAASAGPGDIRINVQYPNSSDVENTATATLRLSDCLYNGVILDRATIVVTYTEGMSVTCDAHLFMDDIESLQLAASADLKESLITGHVNYTGYPAKLVKALAPELLEGLELPEFRSDSPPSMAIILHPSPLKSPAEWEIDAALEATDVMVRKAHFDSLTAAGSWKGQEFDLHRYSGRIAPNVQASGHGYWHHGLKSGRLHVEADGDPLVVMQFSDNEKFLRNYARSFRGFAWNSQARPHSTLDLIYNDRDKGGGLVIDGTSTVFSTSYNGIATERATCHFLVDTANKLVIVDNLQVLRHGRTVSADMLWDWTLDPPMMMWRVDSEIDAQGLLTLINPKWHDLLERGNVVIPHAPTISAAGTVEQRKPWHSIIDGSIQARRIENGRTTYEAASGDVHFTSREGTLHASDVRLGRYTFENMSVDDFTGSFTLKEKHIAAKGQIAGAKSGDWSSGPGPMSFVRTPDKLQITATSATIRNGGWELREVDSDTTVSHEQIRSSVEAASITHGDWTFEALSGSWHRREKEVGYDLKAVSGALGSAMNTGAISMAGSVTGDTTKGIGTIKDVRYEGNRARTEFVSIDFNHGNELQLKLTSDKMTVNDNLVVTEVATDIRRVKSNHLTGNITARSMAVGDFATLDKLAVEFDFLAGRTQFDGTAGSLATDNWSLTDVRASGRSREDVSVVQVESKRAEWQGLPMQTFSSKILVEGPLITLSSVSANAFGGNIDADITYHKERRDGHVRLQLHDAQFGSLLTQISSKKDEIQEAGGTLAGSVNVRFKPGETGTLVNGNGHVQLRDGLLWTVPLLSEFMRLLDKWIPAGDLAKISELDASLSFDGDSVSTDDLRTNGTLVALTGEGSYKWATREPDFVVRAEPLKSFFGSFRLQLPVISDLLGGTVNILMERRLTGTIDEPKWQSLTNVFTDKK